MIRLATLLLAAAAACGSPPPRATHYQLQFDAVDDRGEALAGVTIAVGETHIGATDATGVLRAEVSASKGDRYTLHHKCPAHHDGVVDAENIVFRDTKGLGGDMHARIHVRLQCARQERVAALLVHADGRANMPVLIDGVEQGRTGPGGFAHLRLDMRPGAQFQIAIDSSEHPTLRPVNPRRTMTLGEEDSLFVFDPVFSELAPVKKKRRRKRAQAPANAVPKKSRPERID